VDEVSILGCVNQVKTERTRQHTVLTTWVLEFVNGKVIYISVNYHPKVVQAIVLGYVLFGKIADLPW
jgi:hypothetical protein